MSSRANLIDTFIISLLLMLHGADKASVVWLCFTIVFIQAAQCEDKQIASKRLPYIVNLFSLSPEAFALVPPSYTKCLLVPVPWHAGHCNIGHEKTIPFYMSYNAGGLQGAGFFLYLFSLVFCCVLPST